VLQVHDAAYVGRDIASALNKFDVEIEYQKLESVPKLALKIRRSDCDLIHAHYLRSPAYAAFLSGKPYVISVHGDDIRWGLNPLQKLAVWRARKIFYHASEFHNRFTNSVYIPRPIDFERFKLLPDRPIERAVFFKVVTADPRLRIGESDFVSEISKICVKQNIQLNVREKKGISDMASFLADYQLMFDIRNVPDYSKTGLEAQAMGIHVVGGWEKPENMEELIRSLDRSRAIQIRQNLFQSHSIEMVAHLTANQYRSYLHDSSFVDHSIDVKSRN
jgi:glycosyltransferase involved in cell wall biosynthesis